MGERDRRWWNDLAFGLLPRYVDRDLPVRDDDWKRVHERARYLWRQNHLNFFVYMAMFLVVLPGLVVMVPRWLDLPLPRGLGVVIYLPVCYLVFLVLQRFRYAPHVWRALQERGYPLCAECGYWLRDLPGKQPCPECGWSADDASQRA